MTARVLRALFPHGCVHDSLDGFAAGLAMEHGQERRGVLSRFSGEEAELLPSFKSRGLTSEAFVAYTFLQLQRAVERRRFTLRLAGELARRVRTSLRRS